MESRKQAGKDSRMENDEVVTSSPVKTMHFLQLRRNQWIEVHSFNGTSESKLTGQAAQTAISQTSVLLHVLQLLHVQTQLHRATRPGWVSDREALSNTEDFQRTERELGPHLVGGLVAGVLQRQVHHGVLKCAAHVELQGDVVDALKGFYGTRKWSKTKELMNRNDNGPNARCGCFSVIGQSG